MHRYVDLHYQYLTSSYACMLSCPISLRPFVILEGTWSWALRSPGTKGRGTVSPAPMWGKWYDSLLYIDYMQHIRKVRRSAYTKLIIMDLICCPAWTIIFFFSTKKASCLSIRAHKHMFFRFAKALRRSASGFHLLGIMLWMSLCRYMFLFVSLWRKRMSS